MKIYTGLGASTDRVQQRRPIILIGHSMGGLVIKKASNIYEQTGGS